MLPQWLKGKYVAHRGLTEAGVTENTLQAFENAIAKGYNIEMDVQLTKDGYPVIYHDLHLGRLTDHDCYVKDLTLEEIKNVNYLKGGKIPTLQEALKVCEGRCGIMLEVKKDSYHCPEIDVEEVIYPILKEYKGDFIVKSFNPHTVLWFVTNAPEMSKGLLSEYEEFDEYPEADRLIVKKLIDPKKPLIDFFDYHVNKVGSTVWTEATKNLPVVIWTARSQEQIDKLKEKAINFIFEGFIPA